MMVLSYRLCRTVSMKTSIFLVNVVLLESNKKAKKKGLTVEFFSIRFDSYTTWCKYSFVIKFAKFCSEWTVIIGIISWLLTNINLLFELTTFKITFRDRSSQPRT
jgi:hypothetical protein